MAPVTREPLVLFLLAGAVVFGLERLIDGPDAGGEPGGAVDDPTRIVVTADDLERLEQEWAARWNRPPTDEEFKGLLDAWVKEEILYREAVALGLDQGDTIIRRRLAQKMEFLTADIADLAEPSEEELEAFHRENADRYARDPEMSLVQVYFNPDRRGDAIEADAAATLADLRAGRLGDAELAELAELGDRTLIPIRTERTPLSRIAREFGSEFAEAVASLSPGEWSGPIRSGYGLHLVRVDERTEAGLPPLAEIRDRVLDDFRVEQRQRMNEAVVEALLGKYDVRIERAADDRADGSPDGGALNAADPAGASDSTAGR